MARSLRSMAASPLAPAPHARAAQTLLFGIDRIDDLEGGARDILELIELFIVPARVGLALEIEVAAIVGEDSRMLACCAVVGRRCNDQRKAFAECNMVVNSTVKRVDLKM